MRRIGEVCLDEDGETMVEASARRMRKYRLEGSESERAPLYHMTLVLAIC